jgi:hypothetical protein
VVTPLLLPSGGSMALGSLSLLRDPTFILPFSMCILFHLDSLLCTVSPSSKMPTPGVDRVQGGAVGHDPQDSPGEVAHNSGALTPDKIVVAGAVAPEAPEAVAGDEFLVLAPDMTTAVKTTAAALINSSIGASSL